MEAARTTPQPAKLHRLPVRQARSNSQLAAAHSSGTITGSMPMRLK